MHTENFFADTLNFCNIYRTYFIFHMADLLNNGMVMDMGHVFLSFNIYTFHDFVYIFEWANTKQQQ